MLVHFTKMQGAGNDFVVVDLVSQHIKLTREIIATMADRRLGIGFDQLLVAAPPTDPEADFFYRIYNTDGSEAEQCGNGARCLAKFVRDKQLTPKRKLTFQSINGLILAELQPDERFKINMGQPKFAPEQIPFTTSTRKEVYHLDHNPIGHRATAGPDIAFTLVNMGNPHAVIQVSSITAAQVEEIGPWLANHAAFPEGVNVGFMEIIDSGHIKLRVYERGVGETQACGSGACAAVATKRQHQQLAETVEVSMSGGTITVQWQGPNHDLFQTGPAYKVYDGRMKL